MNASVGQAAERPVQYSARSQSPAFGRQMLPVGFSCSADRNTDGDVPTSQIHLDKNLPDGTVILVSRYAVT